MMLKPLFAKGRRARALALLLLLLCAAALPAVAGASSAPPADWQTVECGGLALSLPPEWELSETFGMRIASLNPNGGGPRANATILASELYAEQTGWDEEAYLADITDGIAYSAAQIESFVTDPIGDWPAIRTVLTAEDATDTYLLYEAIVATGAGEGVRISCVCNVSMRGQLEETLARIIASIREPEQDAAGTPAEGIGNHGGPQPAQKMDQFIFGEDTLDSVTAIVGPRKRTMKESGSGLGYESQAYSYKSSTVRDDLLAYIDYLDEKGFTVVSGAQLDEPGSGMLEGPSASPGARLQVDLSWTGEDYRISVTQKTQTVSDESLRIDPDLLARGQELLDAEAYEEALALFEEAIAAHPYIPIYYFKHGTALSMLDRFEESLASYDTAIILDLKNWEHYAERGVSYYFLDKKEEALADFMTAVELGPADDMTYSNLAYLQAEMGTPEEALLTCASGLAEYPDSPNLLHTLGGTQLSLGNYDEALSAFDKMIEFGYATAEDLGESYAEAKEKAGTADEPDNPSNSEGLAYRNEAYGLSFTLPEGWTEIPDEDRVVFSGPDGSDSMLVVGLTGQCVDDAFAVFFNTSIAEKWIRESRLFSDIAFTEFTPILFASVMDENGRLYAMHMCRFAGVGFPDGYKLLYAQLFFTDENGMLGDVSMLTPATEDNPALPWFDAMSRENIPQDVLTALNEKISAQMLGQD